jgi:predicted DNA-binding WGR domain protein
VVQRFINEGSKKTLVWEIWVDGEEVHQQSGVLGGKMKHTWDRPGSAGKKGTKAFKPADVRAIERANKKIQDKTRKGYREVDENDNVIETASREMDFYEIQRNFRYGKPLGTQPRAQKAIDKVIEDGEPIFTVKRDGLCHFVLVTPNKDIRLYTRRLDECTDWYPYLVAEFKKMKLPTKTIGAFELVSINEKTKRDDRKATQSLSRGLADRAVRLQEDPFRRPHAVMLGFPFWDGEPIMKTMLVDSWMELVFNEVHKRAGKLRYIEKMEIFHGDFEKATQHVIENKLEGLVVYDGDACFGEKAFNFRGRVERTPCYKWKPIFELDAVMVFDPDDEFDSEFEYVGAWGKGRIKRLPGKVALYQYDDSGKLHYLCNVGGGFTDEQRGEALNRSRAGNGIIGVGIIKYVSRTFKSEGDDTNALTEPVFLGFHPDKTIDEATESRLG